MVCIADDFYKDTQGGKKKAQILGMQTAFEFDDRLQQSIVDRY
jgi:hypothetical protein